LCCSRRVHAGCGEPTTRPSCCRSSSLFRSASIRRSRRSTIAASASTARPRGPSPARSTSSPAPEGIASNKAGRPQHLLLAGDCTCAGGQHGQRFLRRVAAVRAGLSRGPGPRRSMLASRGFRRAVSIPRHRWAPSRSARSTTGTTKAAVKTSFQDRLSLTAAAFRIDWRDLQVNVAESAGARAVFHCQRRGRDEPGTGARSDRAACPGLGRLRRPRLHTRAVPGRQHVERRERRRQHAGERAEPHGGFRRAVRAGRLGGGDAHRPRRRRTLRASINMTMRIRRRKKRVLASRTCAPASAASGCSAKRGCGTRSDTRYVADRLCLPGPRRRPGSSARAARRARSGVRAGVTF